MPYRTMTAEQWLGELGEVGGEYKDFKKRVYILKAKFL